MGLNGRIALIITNTVGTMWCAYMFATIALVSLPAAIQDEAHRLIAINNGLTEEIHRAVTARSASGMAIVHR